MTEVQTLGGSWALWLVPLFLACLVVILLAARSELGVSRRRRSSASAAPGAETVPAAETGNGEMAETAAEDELNEILVMAAAAYCMSERRYGGNKMRNLKITVNGKTYDVTVEEEGSSYERAPRFAPPPRAAAPAAPAAKAAAPTPAPKTVPVAPATPAPAASGNGNKIEAPMSGRIVEIVTPVGTAVRKGDTIAVMEAMKLQSEVCSDFDGVVTQILVSPKQDVASGEAIAIVG